MNAVINNAAAAGDTPVIAAVAGQRFRIHGYAIQAAGNTTITFNSGATPLTGPMTVSGAGGAGGAGYHPGGWFVTGVGEAFIVNSSNAVQVSGHVDYSTIG